MKKCHVSGVVHRMFMMFMMQTTSHHDKLINYGKLGVK